ncbi:hypothetical protein B0A49_13131 [Cryomyces minteri]|uniref:Major facilitator superfamily (MFS) profile domain-containing protein n=1 Tax=Cryomyces minteri TaxID=331657 RepID=A0A4U0V2Y3_9PEZI|nr:hypothetical protein B0A49_13131 [Cryomyces minteri]
MDPTHGNQAKVQTTSVQPVTPGVDPESIRIGRTVDHTGFLILGLSLGGNIYSWSHPIVIISLIAACIMGALLILVEKRAALPVLPLAVLSTRPRANIIFSNFFSTIGINTILFNAPLYFQAVKLDSASMSGFRLAAPSLALTVCGVSSGFIMTWSGRMKSLLVLGAFSMLAGSICLFSMWSTIPTWLATVFLIPTSVGQGLTFPASSIAVLATSTQEEQAVTTSILTLWRSIGVVLGVAISSLIVQNGLVAYLDQLVTGPDKAEIILRVRKTVHAIVELSPKHQAEVIDAYEQALRLAFGSAIVMFVIVVALLVPIKLPRLGKR